MSDARTLNPKQRFETAERPSDRDLELYYRNRICFEPVRKLAEEFGLSKSAVGSIVLKVAPWYLAQHVIDDEAMRKEQTAQLIRLTEEAAEQWEQSKLAAETFTASSEEGGKNGAKERKEKRRQARYGDPRLLDVQRGCLKDIRDIWGLDAPRKSENRQVEEFEPREVVYARLQAKLESLIQPKEN